MDMMELLTVVETAALLRTTKQQVRKMIAQQLIPAMKVGREWRISREYLEAFLQSEMAGNAQEKQAEILYRLSACRVICRANASSILYDKNTTKPVAQLYFK